MAKMANTSKFSGVLNLVALAKEPTKYSQSILTFCQDYLKNLLASENWGSEHSDKKFIAACNFYNNMYNIGEMLYTSDNIPQHKLKSFEKIIAGWNESVLNTPIIINALWEMFARSKKKSYFKDIALILNRIVDEDKRLKKFDFNQNQKSSFDLNLQFNDNIKNAKETFYISTNDVADLEGLNKEFREEGRLFSKEQGIEDKYAYLLTDYNVASILKYSKSRSFRKLVYLKSNNMATDGEYSNENIVKEIILNNYENSNFSSAAKEVLYSSNIESQELNTFFNTAKNEIFIPYAALQNKKAAFARKELNIQVIRAWDEAFVNDCYCEKVAEVKEQDVSFDSNLAWEKIKEKVESIFSIKIKELPASKKIYVNDKYWKIYSNKKIIGEIYISTEERNNKEDLNYCASFVDADYFDKGQVPLSFINLTLDKGAKFRDVTEMGVVFHELGHALQFIFRDSEDKYGAHINRNFTDGMEKCLIEFPSQWLEDFANSEEFLSGIMKVNNSLATTEQIQSVLNIHQIFKVESDWENLFKSKLDWIIHKNKQSVRYNLEDKITALQKEFGVHCVRGRNAIISLNKFGYFHMSGSYFSYLFTKNLVRKFNQVLIDFSDKQKGSLLKDWYKVGVNTGLLNTFRQVCNIAIYK